MMTPICNSVIVEKWLAKIYIFQIHEGNNQLRYNKIGKYFEKYFLLTPYLNHQFISYFLHNLLPYQDCYKYIFSEFITDIEVFYAFIFFVML